MTANHNWSRDEILLAINLYCQLPFGKLHRQNPKIIAMAAAIGRTPSSVAMKLSNLASLDPTHQERGVKGLAGASKADRQIWDEFHQNWERLATESEQLRQRFQIEIEPQNSPSSNDDDGKAESLSAYAGNTVAVRNVTVRIAQSFFRRTVLASFESKCCITGIEHPALLVASHIVPWSESEESRVDPTNGLCLSRLHDGAFDRGLITFDEELRLVLSKELALHCDNQTLSQTFKAIEGQPITRPKRFQPQDRFLQHHRQHIFLG